MPKGPFSNTKLWTENRFFNEVVFMSANIAILGDLHGHYTLAFTLLKRWETETGSMMLFRVGICAKSLSPVIRTP